MNLPEYNTGLIEDFSPNIWLGGSISYQERLPGGDWRPYCPTLEKQKDPVETMACVSFSLLNNLETQYKFKGISVNFSDRFLAKISNTQANGNTFEKVADTARKIGLVLESQWPNSPKAQTFSDYYKSIPQDTLNKAVKQDFGYELIDRRPDSLKKHLKQCPIWVTIIAPHPNHAITLLYIEGDNGYFADHYNQQISKRPLSQIAVAAKIVLNNIAMNTNVKTINIDGTIYVAHELNDPADIPYANKFLGSNLTQNSDGTIPTDIMAKKI